MAFEQVSTLAFDKDDRPEVEIGAETFCIIALRKDIGVRSVDNATLTHNYAGRVHVDCFPKATASPDTDRQILTTAAHVFITDHRADGSEGNTTADGAWSEVILDTDSLRDTVAAKSSLQEPLSAHEISHLGNISTDTLRARYEAYIDAINGRNMTQTLPTYCHNVVTHNGKLLRLANYQQLMEGAQAAIPDLEFRIANTVVDFSKQVLAAKLDFRGTPTGQFAGVTPFPGAGKEVRFSEIVFYWFEDGKIAQVVSLVDLDAYRKQVTGPG